MTLKEHKEIHSQLHSALDELMADFIAQTGRTLSNSSIMDLFEWSFLQTINPTEIK